jgi:D-lyxose ketol-isomerase
VPFLYGASWREPHAHAILDQALDIVGPDRLMFASDWPMLTRYVRYGDWVRAVEALCDAHALARRQRDAIFAGNALRANPRVDPVRDSLAIPFPGDPMKRSQINAAVAHAHDALRKHGVRLPAYAYWTPDDWRRAGPEYSRVTLNALGWAVTDFGQGNFDSVGITMFDVRNGTVERASEGTPYGEKIFVLRPGQRLPYHFHWKKTEDIISYHGGTLMIQLFVANDDETMNESAPGVAYFDGVRREFTAGQVFEIRTAPA